MTGKRILITGGAGFIGTHLAERLCADNQLVLLDSFRRDSLAATPGLATHPHVTVATADVLDPAALAPAFEGVDVVLHLAAIAGVSSYYSESLATLRVNILGTANVCAEAARRRVAQLVHFSTSEIFGPDANGVDEESPARIGPVSERRWVYATSKLAGEHFALRTGESAGLRAVVVRPFNVYGPRQTGEGAISNFCAAVVAGKPLTVYGDGSPVRAWCYVDDFVAAVLAILDRPDATTGQAFNLGNPDAVETTLGLARRVQRLAHGAELRFEEVARAEVRARVPVIERARRVLGWTPQIDLDEGLRRTLAWYRSRGRA
ncbi:MAG: NAD-dependent epimerase/dehydratase family protein [Planctomycetes bacterium]|nr:NAD-dependent epimerase/dehydratase family protein [Planctomycetota bacterium]